MGRKLSPLLAYLLCSALLSAGRAERVTAQTPTPSRAFPETGYTVRGLFLQYWEARGGLMQYGYPISDELFETSQLDGRRHKVQYFERAVFERHSDNKPPYDVLLMQLGTFRYRQKYGDTGAPGQRAETTGSGHLFKETGFFVGGAFYSYWKEHGGLARFGYPISNDLDERSDLDGNTYTVQYFERAVMERHPENSRPYDVLLGQLGTLRYLQKYLSPTSTPTPRAATTRSPQPTRTPGGGSCPAVEDARKSEIGATGPIAITGVQFEGEEYVEIGNGGEGAEALGGWLLRDKNEAAQAYRFPEGTVLEGGASLRVFTEPGHAHSFNSGSPIWNNCGDALELFDHSGALLATYAYGTHLK